MKERGEIRVTRPLLIDNDYWYIDPFLYLFSLHF